jgi:hypothetical protein
MLSIKDELTARALFELYKEKWTAECPFSSERVNMGLWPIVFDDTKAFEFHKDFEEDDVRFSRLRYRGLSYQWLFQDDVFRVVAVYGVFSYTLPWITKGVQ